MRKFFHLAVLSVFVLSLTLAALACGSSATPAPGPAPAPAPSPAPGASVPGPAPANQHVAGAYEVEISDENGFSPATITVPVGATVSWYNKSTRRWWVTSDSKVPEVGIIPTGIQKTFTFDKAGEYSYYDLYHPEQKGTVVVK